jgi:hypothetical protein
LYHPMEYSMLPVAQVMGCVVYLPSLHYLWKVVIYMHH